MHDPKDPKTWPKSMRGYRKATDSIIFECACGCGGHTSIKRSDVTAVELARKRCQEFAKGDKTDPVFGEGYFIADHTPVGIAGFTIRSGPRTRLEPSA